MVCAVPLASQSELRTVELLHEFTQTHPRLTSKQIGQLPPEALVSVLRRRPQGAGPTLAPISSACRQPAVAPNSIWGRAGPRSQAGADKPLGCCCQVVAGLHERLSRLPCREAHGLRTQPRPGRTLPAQLLSMQYHVTTCPLEHSHFCFWVTQQSPQQPTGVRQQPSSCHGAPGVKICPAGLFRDGKAEQFMPQVTRIHAPPALLCPRRAPPPLPRPRRPRPCLPGRRACRDIALVALWPRSDVRREMLGLPGVRSVQGCACNDFPALWPCSSCQKGFERCLRQGGLDTRMEHRNPRVARRGTLVLETLRQLGRPMIHQATSKISGRRSELGAHSSSHALLPPAAATLGRSTAGARRLGYEHPSIAFTSCP